MGTRSGDIDPSIIEYISKERNMSLADVNNALNKKSGLQGVSGYSDCRDVEIAIKENNEDAILAMQMYNNRITKFIAEYYLELDGKVDAIVFTAGVGENGFDVRSAVLNKLSPLGIKLDKEINDKTASFRELKEAKITTDDSTVDVFVIPTDEEIMIVRDAYKFV